MRPSTGILLLAFILLFALFGAAFLKAIAIAIGLGVLLLFGSLFLGAVLLRRRMNRKLQQMQQAFQAAQDQAAHRQRTQQMRRDAIDVDAVDVRDDK